jgi:hypothetical protein
LNWFYFAVDSRITLSVNFWEFMDGKEGHYTTRANFSAAEQKMVRLDRWIGYLEQVYANRRL